MNKLLVRQLRRFGGAEETPPAQWQAFLQAVSDAYDSDADDRAMQERILEVMSRELADQHEKLRADVERRRRIEEALRASEARLKREMAERQRIEMEMQLKHKHEAVGQLAAGIAHEINTPVQYVGDSVLFLRSAFEDVRQLLEGYRTRCRSGAPAGGTEIATEMARIEDEVDLEYLDERVTGAFDRVLEGTDRVASIVRAVKEFGRPDASGMSPADVNKAIETTLVVSRNEWVYAARVETLLGELPLVSCHIGDINEVLLNLVVNAAHAIEKRRESLQDAELGCIRISSCVSGDSVLISVSDTGCGIPENIRNRIFDPFFTTKEVGRGIGQGLAIARTIVVDRHAGSLTFETEVGRGTTFTVRLPIAGRVPREHAA